MPQLQSVSRNAMRRLEPRLGRLGGRQQPTTGGSGGSSSSGENLLHQQQQPGPCQQQQQQWLLHLRHGSGSGSAGCNRQQRLMNPQLLMQQQQQHVQPLLRAPLQLFRGIHSITCSSRRLLAQHQQPLRAAANLKCKPLLRGQRLPSSSSSSTSSPCWRSWMRQQLHGSSSNSSSRGALSLRRAYSNLAAAGAGSGSCCSTSGTGSAANAAAAGGWWDTWSLWVDKSSGLLLSSVLNAINLAGSKLPVALGLLLVDMAHNSPLLGGSRADSLTAAYLPDHLPAGGFYANGGHAGGEASSSKGSSSRGTSSSYLEAAAAAWQEVGAALSAGARLIWLGCIWLPALLTAPVALVWGVGRPWWLELLRLSLEASGPAFIKWGQWAATRHDLFAHDVCDALEKLHTNAPAHGFRYTCNVLTKSFGLPPSELFDWIEESPIACGSIGQVHRGRLSAKGAALTGCATGVTVAIKVRHPGVSEAIERDFETMVWLAHAASTLLPATRSLRLDDTLKQFAAPLHEQVDLSREAANLQRFNKNFKRTRAVSFPLPLYPLVSPDVLVESFEKGRHISHYIAAAEGSHPYRQRLAELGSGTMLQMMLVDNLIHSDLHPGNILVRLEPPRGLLGIAYRALNRLAAPDGPAMKALSRALNSLMPEQPQQQQPQQPQQQPQTKDRSKAAAVAAKPAAAVLTAYDSSAQEQQQQQQGIAALQQWLADAAAAAGGPTGLLQRLQQHLAGVAAGWLQPHIVLLDVGMATELSPLDQHNMVGLFRSFATLDGADVARWVLKFSGQEQACEEPQAFVDDMAATFETLKKTIAAHQAAEARWKKQQQQQALREMARGSAGSESSSSSSSNSSSNDGGNGGSSPIGMPEHFDSGAEALGTVLELVRVHGVTLPGHICSVVVTTLILEGWSNKLAPDHSVLNQVQGMFSPAMYSWHDRMDTVVDLVMDRGDTALTLS